jgi:hypothetical protein
MIYYQFSILIQYIEREIRELAYEREQNKINNNKKKKTKLESTNIKMKVFPWTFTDSTLYEHGSTMGQV